MRALAAIALIAIALLLAGLSYYAFIESKSVPWGAGYAGGSLCVLVVAVSMAARRSRGN